MNPTNPKTPTIVFMYHRICERSPLTECYFNRGTAVEPHIFRQQLLWLSKNTTILSCSDWWDQHPIRHSPKPIVVITMDDGYLDCIQVASICREMDLPPPIVFAIAEHTGDSPTACWVDTYYAILHTARVRNPKSLEDIGGFDCSDIPSLQSNLDWWVRGPLKKHLFSLTPQTQQDALCCLHKQMDASVDLKDLPKRLYVTRSQLKIAYKNKILEVGGHSAFHRRLATIAYAEMLEEIAVSVDFLHDIEVPTSPRFFAYPDGSFNKDVANLVKEQGFAAAFTVESGYMFHQTEPMSIPRFIVRNKPTTDPNWCEAFSATSS